MSNSISDHLYAWEGFLGRKAKKKNARLFPYVIFWSIWRERNRSLWGCGDATSTF